MDIGHQHGQPVNLVDKISSFVATTEMMLEKARQGEWEKLAEMEAKRRPELEAFFNALDSTSLNDNAGLLRQAIEKMLDLDQQIIVLGVESKNNLSELMQKSLSTRQAMSEYQKNTVL